MPDLQKPMRQSEQRLGEASREILRIEAHLRRGEERAAKARIDGVRAQLKALRSDAETPMRLTLMGLQLGITSGGSWLRGRAPAAILIGAAGWMVGQAMADKHRQEARALTRHLDYLEAQLQPAPTESTTP